MDLEDPPGQNPTGQNRRQFLQRTGAASAAAALGLSGRSTAMTEDGEFETNPFTLGVASGDPLPNSVILWTRLAPDPLTVGGGMPDRSVDVSWTVAADRRMTETVTSGTATAEPTHVHTLHINAQDLEPNTEYYYQFEAGGETSPVGRTKTAPKPDASIDEFQFAFASCQAWDAGFFTAYQYMADEELDLVVHLGDYIYEYGIGANGGVRNKSIPTPYRDETESLDRYRLQYGLYKSAPGLKEAHASAPWLITRDDHEVDNNWADEVPQDPDEQTVRQFLKRRAAAFKAYYEHMPFRGAQKPTKPDTKPEVLETNRKIDQKLYRNYSFGDLIEFSVLDTRQYRSDQACNDAFAVDKCKARFAEDRTILGDNQEQWLVDNLRNSDATWDVLANQLPFAKMDFRRGEEDGYRMDQWDGYVPDQRTVKNAFEEHAENPIVVTGDFHSHWANEIRSASDASKAIGAEFVGTSISSFGNGSELDDFNGDNPGVLGEHVIRENDNVKYNSARRGYTSCTVTPETWTTEFKVLPYVTDPGAPIRTDATFEVQAGDPGLQPQSPALVADSLAVGYGKTGSGSLLGRWLSDGVSGGTVTLAVSNPEIASFTGATVDDAFGIGETNVAKDGSSVTIRFADLQKNAQSVVGGNDTPLASFTLRGVDSGTTDIEISVSKFNDDSGGAPETTTEAGVLVVGPPPVTGSTSPTDPDNDGRFEDVNGNGRLDYEDIQTLFDNFESDSVTMNKSAYDFNQNGKLDFDDIVDLFGEVN